MKIFRQGICNMIGETRKVIMAGDIAVKVLVNFKEAK